MTVETRSKSAGSRLGRLYRGESNIDFIGRTKLWFLISGAVLAIGLISLGVRGLNLGIDFEGGAVFEVPSATLSLDDARHALEGAGIGGEPKVQELESSSGRFVRAQTPTLSPEQATAVQDALARAAGVPEAEVSRSEVGPSWGQEISRKALRALVVFLIVISLYITLRFEFKMAMPTLAALIHDVLVTVGVYSVLGFEVTPATVIAVLTILGFSIYDGIVVFDRVNENTRLVSASGRMTYGDMVNVSLNETLMRSLNTSITALLPIVSLLTIGSFALGATTLQEFGLALLVGLASGAYSSIFIASPLLALVKEREPRYREVRRRIELKADRRDPGPVTVTEPDAAAPVTPSEAPPTTGPRPEREAVAPGEHREPVAAGGEQAAPVAVRATSSIPPRPRKKGKRR
ncbi:MAG: protein translocase subunit SecF [Acidimicrobiia bacterium]